MSVKCVSVLIALLVLVAGCASTVKYSDPSFVDLAEEDGATLHVSRPNSAWGSAIRTPVYVNNELIGRIGPGGHIETAIPTGRVSVSVTTSDYILEAEQNAEYFLKITMPAQMWLMTPSFNIELIDKTEGTNVVESHKR